MRWMAAVLALWLGTPLLQGCAGTTGAARPEFHSEGASSEEIASRFRLPRLPSRKSKSPTAKTPSTASSNPNKHLLSSIEPWRKPRLTDDKRIHPYSQTRQPASPIPNLGLSRAGTSISDGKHTNVGRMQLVKFEEHRLATPHTGGMAIWGGGYP